jgi:hypothetical protein
MKSYSGSCLCKKVVFAIDAEFGGFFLCHCSRCRKVTGTAHGANLFAQTFELKWISGVESVKTYRLPESRFTKSFCEACGSGLPFVGVSGRLVVPAGSLDSDVDVKPSAHIFVGSKANWDQDLDLVERIDALP